MEHVCVRYTRKRCRGAEKLMFNIEPRPPIDRYTTVRVANIFRLVLHRPVLFLATPLSSCPFVLRELPFFFFFRFHWLDNAPSAPGFTVVSPDFSGEII